MERSVASSISPTIRRKLTRPDSVEAAVDAMKLFIAQGDRETFQHAVSIYCTAARKRAEQIETVVSALCRLATDIEGPRGDEDALQHPTEMHGLIFEGILRAFYGDVAVERASGASAQRKADASQHGKTGTWPKRTAD